MNEATRPLSFQIFTLALAITLCFTVYTEGANVTSPTPASVSTKTTKVVTVTTPSVTNLSSEPASKTIHVSPTKVYALRPQDPSPSNSLNTYTMEHNAPLPPPLRKPDNGNQVCSSVNEEFFSYRPQLRVMLHTPTVTNSLWVLILCQMKPI